MIPPWGSAWTIGAPGEFGYHGQEGYRTRHDDANRGVPLPTHQRPCGDLFGGEQNHPEYDPAHPAGYETASTGLMMVGAREYDPEIGRFLQPDPQPTGPELQWGQLNRWAYCANDPVNASDPSGEWAIVFAVLGWVLTILAILLVPFTKFFAALARICFVRSGLARTPPPPKYYGPPITPPGVNQLLDIGFPLPNNAFDQLMIEGARV